MLVYSFKLMFIQKCYRGQRATYNLLAVAVSYDIIRAYVL